MIEIPEDGWGADAIDVPSSLLDGSGGSAGESLAGWNWADEEPSSTPVDTADSARDRARGVFRRQRSIGAFNRELDTLYASIAEAPDWSDGLKRFDRQVETLRQRHTGDLNDAEDREAFARHAGEFAAMQRIGLKRALVERQVNDALSQLDDQLAYYAGKAADADYDAFRQIATDSGLRAIDELREAGYLTTDAAEIRKTGFLGRVAGSDAELQAAAEPNNNPGENPDDLRGLIQLAGNLLDGGIDPADANALTDFLKKLLGRDLLPKPRRSGEPQRSPLPIPPRLPKPPLVPPTVGDEPDRPPREYTPTKPIGEGAERYKQVGNRKFVQYHDGSIDFGRIDATIARQAGVREAPVRLPKGDDYRGEQHLELPSRAKQLQRAGYPNAASFVDDVSQNFTEIWEGQGDSLMLVVRPSADPNENVHTLFISLQPSAAGDAYEVVSGGVFRGKYPAGNKRHLLWHGVRSSP